MIKVVFWWYFRAAHKKKQVPVQSLCFRLSLRGGFQGVSLRRQKRNESKQHPSWRHLMSSFVVTPDEGPDEVDRLIRLISGRPPELDSLSMCFGRD